MHYGKSKGKGNTRKVCKNMSILRNQGGNFAKVGGREKFAK